MKSATRSFGSLGVAALAIGPMVVVCAGLLLGWDLHSRGINFGATVMQATVRSTHSLTTPIQLSDQPLIVLEQASFDDAAGSASRGAGHSAASRRLQIDQPVFAVFADRSGAAQPSLEQVVPALVSRMKALDFDVLVIRRGTIRFPADRGEMEVLTDVDAEIEIGRRGAAALKAEVTYRGQRVKISGSGSGVFDRGRTGRIPGKFTVASALFDARFEGNARVARGLSLGGNVEIKAARLRDVARWLEIPAPYASNLENAKLTGKLDWAGGAMSFSKVVVLVDGNQGTGTLNVAFAGRQPTVEGTLAFKQLDLTPYIRAAVTQSSLLAPVGTEVVRHDRGSTLEALDVDLRISADAVVMPGIAGGRGAVAISLKKGRLLADIAELEIEKGTFRGQIELHGDREPQRAALRGRFDGVEAGRILAPLIDRNPLQGRADVTVDLSSDGGTLDDFISRMTGKMRLKLLEGGKLGLDLRTLLQAAKRADTRGWPAVGASSTGVDSLEALVRVEGGTVQTEEVSARSGSLAIGGKGAVDLRRREIDLLIAMDPVGTGQAAAKRGDKIVLKGPLTNPRIWYEAQ